MVDASAPIPPLPPDDDDGGGPSRWRAPLAAVEEQVREQHGKPPGSRRLEEPGRREVERVELDGRVRHPVFPTVAHDALGRPLDRRLELEVGPGRRPDPRPGTGQRQRKRPRIRDRESGRRGSCLVFPTPGAFFDCVASGRLHEKSDRSIGFSGCPGAAEEPQSTPTSGGARRCTRFSGSR